jgi:hypothetical protein
MEQEITHNKLNEIILRLDVLYYDIALFTIITLMFISIIQKLTILACFFAISLGAVSFVEHLAKKKLARRFRQELAGNILGGAK